MELKLRYHPEFIPDVDEYASWFEEQQPGLGDEFGSSVEIALQKLVERQMSHRRIWDNVRRVLIRRFNIIIPFEVTESEILIFGVVHGSRDLDRWIARRTKDL